MDEEKLQEKIVVDPRLLERALKRMRGLVRGNGFNPENVLLNEENKVFQYRFPAKVTIKLVPKYGIKTEPGKNTLAELAVSQEDFQKKIQSAVSDVQSKPEKRQKVVDFIFSRSDKGFGIETQNVTFRDLAFDLVRHDKCQTCAHSGNIACANCHRRGMVSCLKCRGTRTMRCPKCGGSAHTRTTHGQSSCDYCRATGKVPCNLCHAKGMMKCPKCAASGVVPCEKCSGTGWLSHLAHVEIEGQIHFSFDRDKLPKELVLLIENRGPFLVSKGDLEVSIVAKTETPMVTKSETDLSENKVRDDASDLTDLIIIEYDATCPYGPLSFQLAEREVPAMLLGWQARLIEAPAFLEDLTKVGIQAIEVAAGGGGDTVSLLRKAAGFALWREMLSQIILSGNIRKAVDVTLNRYPTGVSEERIKQMVLQADRAVRFVTRRARYIGLALGMGVFSALSYAYFAGGWRQTLVDRFSQLIGSGADVLLWVVGVILGVVASQIFASHSQSKSFSGVIPEEVLKRTPRTGNIIWWSVGVSLLIGVLMLGIAIAQGQPLPEWLIPLASEPTVSSDPS